MHGFRHTLVVRHLRSKEERFRFSLKRIAHIRSDARSQDRHSSISSPTRGEPHAIIFLLLGYYGDTSNVKVTRAMTCAGLSFELGIRTEDVSC